MLAELPYEDRFMLYGAWRGHGMEKHALGVKHAQYAVAEVSQVQPSQVYRCSSCLLLRGTTAYCLAVYSRGMRVAE